MLGLSYRLPKVGSQSQKSGAWMDQSVDMCGEWLGQAAGMEVGAAWVLTCVN